VVSLATGTAASEPTRGQPAAHVQQRGAASPRSARELPETRTAASEPTGGQPRAADQPRPAAARASASLRVRHTRPAPPPLFAAIAPQSSTAAVSTLLGGVTFSFSCSAGAYGTITLAAGGASQLVYVYNCSGLGETVTIRPGPALAAALRSGAAEVTLTLDVPMIFIHLTTPGIASATITVAGADPGAAASSLLGPLDPDSDPIPASPVAEAANVSHAGWPVIDGDLVIAPGAAPVGDRLHHDYTWAILEGTASNDELLGGADDDIIFGGAGDDVIWGDQTPGPGAPGQHDELYGGPGNDIIYTSHSYNYVNAGPGDDLVHAEVGYGSINCGPGDDTVLLTPATEHRYSLTGCEHLRIVPARA
jgi:RTX calcium-binding nonapeptide repeat (4 copies)